MEFFKFDLSAVPDNAAITSAYLDLFFLDATGLFFSGNNHLFHVGNDSWFENTITWNNQPSRGALLYQRGHPLGPYNSWFSYDLMGTGFWNYASDLNDNALSLLMTLETSGTHVWPYSLFASKEYGQSRSPELVLNYYLNPPPPLEPIPEPSTMLLFGVGLLCIAGVSRRKKTIV